MSKSSSAPSNRTRIRRLPELANYERQSLYAILDESYICHIAFSHGESSHCIPTACWRVGNYLYIHGSNGGRLTKAMLSGRPVSLAVTHIDGLVLAKSAFNHSMNYRSAVIYGEFEQVEDNAAKLAAMDAFMDKIAAGRKYEARPGNSQELAATSVMRIALDEAACKISDKGPADKPEDQALAVWTGVLPLKLARGKPVAAADSNTHLTPDYVEKWAI